MKNLNGIYTSSKLNRNVNLILKIVYVLLDIELANL